MYIPKKDMTGKLFDKTNGKGMQELKPDWSGNVRIQGKLYSVEARRFSPGAKIKVATLELTLAEVELPKVEHTEAEKEEISKKVKCLIKDLGL